VLELSYSPAFLCSVIGWPAQQQGGRHPAWGVSIPDRLG
jgi:hypothetical protein